MYIYIYEWCFCSYVCFLYMTFLVTYLMFLFLLLFQYSLDPLNPCPNTLFFKTFSISIIIFCSYFRNFLCLKTSPSPWLKSCVCPMLFYKVMEMQLHHFSVKCKSECFGDDADHMKSSVLLLLIWLSSMMRESRN